MGEVYRGRDTKLKREVAIKILPEEFSRDADRVNRFQREAEVLASLSHPNLAAIYSLEEEQGSRFLVLELVEGETLDERIKRGPIPIEETLHIAKSICEALEAAHEKGVVHRDLKPANVKITPDGKVKVLDFGLAKAMEREQTSSTFSNSPTLMSMAATNAGLILGTASYMSPEQARGERIDSRSDVFSFGCLLYEMLTGRQAFEGKTVSDILAGVLRVEPDFTVLPKNLNPRLYELLRRCLEKNVKRRWHAAADLELELEAVAANVYPKSENTQGAHTAAPPKLWVAIACGSSLIAIAFAGLFWINYRASPESPVVRFQIAPPDKMTFDSTSGNAFIAMNAGTMSPDGRKIAFTAKDEPGKVNLWVRSLDTMTARLLPGTEEAGLPFWSPDSKSIGFFTPGKLKKVDVDGGRPLMLANVSVGRGGTWSRDGVIVFSPSGVSASLLRVSAAGGEPIPATTQQSGSNRRFPSFLPDGKHFLFSDVSNGTAPEIFWGSLESAEVHPLLASDSGALYAPPGYLLFVRQGTLLAQPFDAKKMALTGEAVPIAEQVAFDIAGAWGFSVSDNGTLEYRMGTGTSQFQLDWVDRSGKVVDSAGVLGLYRSPAISPDGKRIAVYRHEGNGGDIWLMEPFGGKASRLTFDASQDNAHPIWVGGNSIVFESHRNGKWGIYQKLSNGTGPEELLFESDPVKVPMSWSPAANTVLFEVADPKNNGDIWALPLTGDRKPFPLLQTQFGETHPQISPDGKWFAYNSNETGRVEIYVQSFPPGRGKWQISINGGVFSRWRPDGKELFYMTNVSYGKIAAVSVQATGSTFEFSAPRLLFDSGYLNVVQGPGGYNTFDVSADGQRFLIPRPDATNVAAALANTPINVVLNWPALINKK